MLFDGIGRLLPSACLWIGGDCASLSPPREFSPCALELRLRHTVIHAFRAAVARGLEREKPVAEQHPVIVVASAVADMPKERPVVFFECADESPDQADAAVACLNLQRFESLNLFDSAVVAPFPLKIISNSA